MIIRFIKSNIVLLLAAIFFLGSAVYFADQKGFIHLLAKTEANLIKQTASETAQAAFDFCNDPTHWYGVNKETCYSKEFKKIALNNGPLYSFEALGDLQKLDKGAEGCHLIAHGIGWGTYLKDPNHWREEIQVMSSSCSYGAIHGVIESYVGSLPDHKLPKELIPTICGVTPRADCNHIVGHLLLVQTNAKIDPALELCTVFTETRQRAFCQTGVFMEYSTAVNLLDHGLAPKSWGDWPSRMPELEKLCRSYDGEAGAACWEEIIHAALVTFHNDPAKLLAFCATSQLDDGAKRCRRHGMGVVTSAFGFDLDKLKPFCELPQKNDPNFQMDCYASIVGSMMATFPDNSDQGSKFCESIDIKFQSSCFYQVTARNNDRAKND